MNEQVLVSFLLRWIAIILGFAFFYFTGRHHGIRYKERQFVKWAIGSMPSRWKHNTRLYRDLHTKCKKIEKTS